MGFVSELKRRNVFRVGTAYVLAAWLLIQIAETLFPAFNVPDSILRGLAFVLLLGFPVALLVSWIYDIEHDMDRQRATLAERTEDSKLDLDSWQIAVQEARVSEQ